jgi:hypothetical protein
LQNFKFQISLFVEPGSLFGGLILLDIGVKTLLLLAPVHSSTTVGELAARAKTNSPKEQLRKPLQNFKFQISSFVAPGSLFGGLILLEIGG